MKMVSKEIGSWGILEIDGTVDSVHTKTFIDTLAEYVGKLMKCKNLILDLSRADFLSIGAIRFVSQVSTNLEEASGRMVIMGANDRIRRHFDIFIGLKKLKEINNVWEVIPLQMSSKLNEAKSIILAGVASPIETPATMDPREEIIASDGALLVRVASSGGFPDQN